MPDSAIYSDKETKQYSEFSAAILEASQADGVTFDSGGANEVMTEMVHAGGKSLPPELAQIIDERTNGDIEHDNEIRAGIAKAVFDGISAYKAQHGSEPTGDVMRWAAHQGWGTTNAAAALLAQDNGTAFDSASASNEHHDQSSMQANRAVVAITSAIAEAIPVAHYLPADIKSNESKLVIVSHKAGSDWGEYAKGDLMDGISSGGAYIASERTIKLDEASGLFSGKFTAKYLAGSPDKCDPTADVVKLIPNRAIVKVNGFRAGGESVQSGTSPADSPLTGSVKVLDNSGASTIHVLSGKITAATGVVEASFTPALPANSVVQVTSYVDYEAQPELTPVFNTDAQKFSLYASPWQAKTEQTIESRSQFQNEVGLDISSEAMFSLRYQYANERHYNIIRQAEVIGMNNHDTFDFNAANQVETKERKNIWVDFAPTLTSVDQKMANRTMDHGMTHLYIGDALLAQLTGLPPEIFVSSGISAKAGIYRVGKLFGKYEIYYNPRLNNVPANTGRIVGVGRSTQVARNPFVLGDAVAPMVLPFSMSKDFRHGMGYHARNFTDVNPHQESAMGCAVIDVINLP